MPETTATLQVTAVREAGGCHLPPGDRAEVGTVLGGESADAVERHAEPVERAPFVRQFARTRILLSAGAPAIPEVDPVVASTSPVVKPHPDPKPVRVRTVRPDVGDDLGHFRNASLREPRDGSGRSGLHALRALLRPVSLAPCLCPLAAQYERDGRRVNCARRAGEMIAGDREKAFRCVNLRPCPSEVSRRGLRARLLLAPTRGVPLRHQPLDPCRVLAGEVRRERRSGQCCSHKAPRRRMARGNGMGVRPTEAGTGWRQHRSNRGLAARRYGRHGDRWKRHTAKRDRRY